MNIVELVKKSGLWDTIGNPKELKVFADLVRERCYANARAEREWVDLTDDEKVMLSDRLNLDRRIVVIDAVIAAFKKKNK